MKWTSFPLRLVIAVGLFFSLNISPVLAEVEVNKEAAEPGRIKEIGKQVLAAKEESLQAIVLEGARRVTFQEILENPDDLDLNLRYAKLQVVEGNLLGASATLERILLIKPDAAPVRLFYAVVLFRLDNLNEAARELALLQDVEMPDSLRKELNLYKRRIKQRRQQTRVTMRQSFGFQMDDNRNSAASSKQRWSNGSVIALTGVSKKRRDTSMLNISSVDVVHDLGFQAGHTMKASFTYFFQDQTMIDSSDLDSYSYNLGGTYKGRWFDFTPQMNFSHVGLSRQPLLRTQGGSFDLKRDNWFDLFGKAVGVSAKYKIERQDYRRISENPAGEEREGPFMQADLGINYQIRPRLRLTSNLVWAHKSAKKDFNDADKLTLKAGMTLILGEGAFLLGAIELAKERFGGVDGSIVHRERRDKSLRARVTYGFPLANIMFRGAWAEKIVPKQFKDVSFIMTYEYNRVVSNITNNQYRNNKYQMILSKTWNF